MSTERNRRDFIKKSSAVVATSVIANQISKHAHAAGSDEIRFCVVGCGGRGTGAAAQIFNTKGSAILTWLAPVQPRLVRGGSPVPSHVVLRW